MTKKTDQEVYIWPPSKDAGRQEVYVNPPGGRPPEASSATPHFAAGTSHLVIVVAVGLFLVVTACGIAAALTAGTIW